MTRDEIVSIVKKQRDYFKTGETLSIEFRQEQIYRLKRAIKKYEDELTDALAKDLGRCETEAYFCDVGSVILEISETIKGLKKWAKPEKHFSGIMSFPSTTTMVYKMPYGTALIISPFNFPFMLSLGVLTACIAGGNTAVIKASSKSVASTEVLKRLIADTFKPEYITVVDGGHDVADICLEQRFDKIFYTGSQKIGKHVMKAAAENLTPVTLELGGENGNWCIVRKDADIRDAARKVAFFKMLNGGQVCININQVAVADEVAEKFIEELKKAIIKQVGETPERNPEYPRLISRSAYDKCAEEAEEYRDRIVFGGRGDDVALKYSPTIIYPVGIDEAIVNHELFNPLLPVVPFKDREVDNLLRTIADREHMLAFYLFSRDLKWAKSVMSTSQYGGGCINEVCIHLMVKGVPFGGIGHSGMGAYHGEWGFREFTHPQTVLIGRSKMNLSLREHPYERNGRSFKLKLIRKFER